jgi:hypothetical protein
MSGTVWSRLSDFPDYAVSGTGGVMRIADCTNRYGRSRAGTVIKSASSDNYPRVNLYVSGRMKRVAVHRLVARYFVPNPHDKPQVNHIDGNKNRNTFENLEWVTAKEKGIIYITP